MASKARTKNGSGLIFRRFVTRNGITYDAWKYGKKAWPIPVKADEKR